MKKFSVEISEKSGNKWLTCVNIESDEINKDDLFLANNNHSVALKMAALRKALNKLFGAKTMFSGIVLENGEFRGDIDIKDRIYNHNIGKNVICTIKEMED